MLATVPLKDVGTTLSGNLQWLGFSPSSFWQSEFAQGTVLAGGILTGLIYAWLLWYTRERPEPRLPEISEYDKHRQRLKAENDHTLEKLKEDASFWQKIWDANHEKPDD